MCKNDFFALISQKEKSGEIPVLGKLVTFTLWDNFRVLRDNDTFIKNTKNEDIIHEREMELADMMINEFAEKMNN